MDKRFDQTLNQRRYTNGKYAHEKLELSLLGNGIDGLFPFPSAKYNWKH